jgi:hypothetical protein
LELSAGADGAEHVAVDVTACSYKQGDFGINIAHQIADKVPNQ